MTSRMTPMQEPANMPELRMCQERAMKQESMVYQFQSILGEVKSVIAF